MEKVSNRSTRAGFGAIEESGEPMNGYFTTHHNWDWVVQEAFAESTQLAAQKCSSSRRLPSASKNPGKERYSLFRLDVASSSSAAHDANDTLIRIRLDSPCMENLDPKDLLYRRLVEAAGEQYAPLTTLIPWDATEETFASQSPVPFPAMLKAPLGSGGFGLYFVYHWRDIWEVLRNHRARAERHPNFLSDLLSSYNGLPLCWSLQELIEPVPCRSPATGDLRRSQIRGYVVCGNGRVFLYTTLEVRLPAWEADLAKTIAEETRLYGGETVLPSPEAAPVWSDEVERECCGTQHARPYNSQRCKASTERYLLSELSELAPYHSAILECLRRVFAGLKPSLLAQSTQPSHGQASLAIAGVDLLATHTPASGDVRVVIVEVNNNPAMPKQDKHMSNPYALHLHRLVQAVADLGHSLACGQETSPHRELGTLFASPLASSFEEL